MEPHESSGGVTPQRDTLNDFEQQVLFKNYNFFIIYNRLETNFII